MYCIKETGKEEELSFLSADPMVSKNTFDSAQTPKSSWDNIVTAMSLFKQAKRFDICCEVCYW
jgi:hypothetical protein